VPVTIKFGVPLLLAVFAAVVGWRSWQASRAYLSVVDAGGAAVGEARLEFYRHDESPDAASPTERLGELRRSSAGSFSVGSDLVPGAAVVRVSVPGSGIGFGFAQTGRTTALSVGPPITVRGQLTDSRNQPVAGARVVAFGGGSRGVPLVETESGEDGRFVLEGISKTVAYPLIRVIRAGFAVEEKEIYLEREHDLAIQLRETAPGRGRVVAELAGAERPGGAPGSGGGDGPGLPLDLEGLEVRVFHVPGLTTRTGPGGVFRLDELPPSPTRCFVLLSTLPRGWTHRRCPIRAGGPDVTLEVSPSATVRGRVVNGNTGFGVGWAKVLHEHGPAGMEVVQCDGAGFFEIGRVPPGPVELRADVVVERRIRKDGSLGAVVGDSIRSDGVRRSKKALIQGRTDLLIVPGEVREGVEIRVY